MVLLAWPLVFFLGWLVFLSVCSVFFFFFFNFSLWFLFVYPLVYFWEPCSLLLNILLLLIKKN